MSGDSRLKLKIVKGVCEGIFKPEFFFENEAVQGRLLNEPVVIICNHTRRTKQRKFVLADGPMLRCVFRNKNVCSLMAKDILEKPVIRTAMKGLNCIPVDRTAASTQWLRDCKEKLDSGCSVIIFPEGTTIKDKEIDEFKPGFALLAKMAGVRVLPVAINGKYKVFGKKELKIKIGTPVELSRSTYSREYLQNEADRCRRIIDEMYKEII
ncbi:MAG: 1-acyl-sn-glycerol-3-phosphate acyltransferase [Clostridia bacterium]|nr:1-acyl-sn-glycerol-3-phosphate acyltransferase [Clostridia bacterium]